MSNCLEIAKAIKTVIQREFQKKNIFTSMHHRLSALPGRKLKFLEFKKFGTQIILGSYRRNNMFYCCCKQRHDNCWKTLCLNKKQKVNHKASMNFKKLDLNVKIKVVKIFWVPN